MVKEWCQAINLLSFQAYEGATTIG
jgi:hypothetical protein